MASITRARRQIWRAGRLAVLALAATGLAGCVTNANVPNSPFLTAVARFNPLAAAPAVTGSVTAPSQPPPAVADRSLDDLAIRGSLTDRAPPPAPQAQPMPPSTATLTAGPMTAAPLIERKEVYPQVSNASAGLASIAPPGSGAADRARLAKGRGILLSHAVTAAVLNHPLMGAQAAKVTGSLADVRSAQGATLPQFQVYAGSGGSYLGTYANSPKQFSAVDIPGTSRSDAGFTLRQLVYDFGAAKADISRNKSTVDAERLRLADQAEDIALRTVNAYFNVLEQSELITLINKVVADDNSFAELVKLNEAQGNSTVADVNRIRSKVIEVEALRTDISTALKTAEDEFFRLTKLDPAQVRRAAPGLPAIPPAVEPALEIAKKSNPSLLAFSATGRSIDYQLASQQAQRLPRVDLQGDGLMKHYLGMPSASQGVVDTRLMLMVSYKMYDGGTMAAQADRIREDKKANDFKTLDEKEGIELNLRRFYQALSANRIKESAAIQGTATAQKANTLYMEQFKAGKRTVFEVLDSRMVVFTMQKNAVNGKYEQLRSAYGILRNEGRLVEALARISAG